MRLLILWRVKLVRDILAIWKKHIGGVEYFSAEKRGRDFFRRWVAQNLPSALPYVKFFIGYHGGSVWTRNITKLLNINPPSLSLAPQKSWHFTCGSVLFCKLHTNPGLSRYKKRANSGMPIISTNENAETARVNNRTIHFSAAGSVADFTHTFPGLLEQIPSRIKVFPSPSLRALQPVPCLPVAWDVMRCWILCLLLIIWWLGWAELCTCTGIVFSIMYTIHNLVSILGCPLTMDPEWRGKNSFARTCSVRER